MGSLVVTARLDEETLASLDRIANGQERSRAWLIGRAVKRFVDEEEALAAFVRVGVDAADRGDVVSQEEMEAWFEARHRSVATG